LPTPCAASPPPSPKKASPPRRPRPLLFDLTSLQREANGKFGFSAKTTLALAQSLYERHKALTYPRTDSRHLPEDYLPVVKQTFEMLADSGMKHLAPFAPPQALNNGYVKPTKRMFDNAKVSDHFAIIPTLQAPSGLSEAEQKLYDLVVRRFMAVFFPSAEYQVTTRISTRQWQATASRPKARCWSSRAGWPSTARKPPTKWPTPKKATRARTWCPCKPGEMVRAEAVDPKGLKTRPPARYSEATLLGAMEGAGKLSKTTSCAKPCRKKAWARPPPAPPSSKA
jgi:DNA topoisomerase-3